MGRLLIVDDTAELAALIASAARARGHQVDICHSGAAALGRLSGELPQLAIVDLLLPDVDGKDVLRELGQRGVRTIAISGVYKGEKLAQEVLDLRLAELFFEKPFELRALLDAGEALLGFAAGRRNEEDEEDEEDEDALEELEVLSPVEDGPDLPIEEAPPESGEELPTTVSTLPVPEEARPEKAAPAGDQGEDDEDAEEDEEEEEQDEVPTQVSAPPPDLLSALAEPEPPPQEAPKEPLQPLPFAERERVWAKPEREQRPQRELPEWSHAGDLATTAVPRLLTAYFQASHGGELKLRQGNVNKVVYFEEGCPVYAASNLASERFTRFCVRRGVLDESQVAEVARRVKEKNIRSGEALLELGLLDAPKRQALLEDQVREIIWSTFAWSAGEYTFSPRRPARTDLVKLRVHPGNLILQGVQRTEPLVSLRKKVPPTRRLFPAPDPAYPLHELELSGPQAMLLAYADGSKTVEDLLTLADLPEREALATLLGLEQLGVLVERRDENKKRRITFGL